MRPGVTGLTVDEQISLTSGEGFWRTKEMGGIPAVEVADGPHGVRSQVASADQPGITIAPPATCFPPAVALAQTWDPQLIERVGAAIGLEARHLSVDIVLGPGINIKRDPRCGRNFEYYSEDPHLTGVLGSAWVRGVQSQGVGTSLKHFAVNNQETDRMSVSADVDERPLREIYLRAFERVIRDAAPTTVMCSYNRINGELASQNRWLLTDVLRDEWGFEGVVMSDWGAVHDRGAAIAAGLDLEMPGTNGVTDASARRAVDDGTLSMDDVSRAAARVADLADRLAGERKAIVAAPLDHEAHHELARQAAERAIVLLSNRDAVLPIRRGRSIAVIGELAVRPRVQGGGSSRVNATRTEIPFDEIAACAEADVTWAAGVVHGADEAHAAELRAEAADLAASHDVAVVIVGLGDQDEVEGIDRTDIALPAGHEELVEQVVAAQPNTVVIVVHGGVVALARLAAASPALVDVALTGQASASALAAVLFGDVNPSGRLAETVPARLADCPSFTSFPGEGSRVRYGEGVFVGYRWFDARELDVVFPFGHGLSYATFAYDDASARRDGDHLIVSVRVTNVSERCGREVVQVYAVRPSSEIARAPRELVGFASVELEAGEGRHVEVRIRTQDLAAWHETQGGWWVESGVVEFHVGASSRDIRTSVAFHVDGDHPRRSLTLDSRLVDVLERPEAAQALAQKVDWLTGGAAGEAVGVTMATLMASLPVRRLAAFTGGAITLSEIAEIVEMANARDT